MAIIKFDFVLPRMICRCHCGSVPDDTIYNNTYHEHPLKSWEFWCADGIYDSCHGVLTRYIQGGGGVLTQFETFMSR